MSFGTKIVGGVTPGKGGTTHLGLPVFNSVAEAVDDTGADVSGIFVPPALATDSLLEAAEAGVDVAVIIADGVPVQDMVRTKRYLAGRSTMIIGSELARHHHAGRVQGGHHAQPHLPPRPRRRREPHRARSTTRPSSQMTKLGLGQSTCVGHRRRPGERHGLPHGAAGVRGRRRHRRRRDDRRDRRAAGGGGRARGRRSTCRSRWWRFIAGVSAPRGRRMGHAGAVISGESDTATAKLDAIERLGHRVVRNPADIGDTVLRAAKGIGDRSGPGGT